MASSEQLERLKLVRRRAGSGRSVVRAGAAVFGSADFIVAAGPCSVESEAQILRGAEAVAAAGAQMLRGGCFKPRTSPYDFQGLEVEGLKLLRKAGDAVGLAVVTEAMSPLQVPHVAEWADMIQIGSRSMGNLALLRAAGESGRPVLLKRGMVATIEELLEAAECILETGNSQVVLCERGIRTFGTLTRNTCDIVAVPLLQQLTHLPVILDPSHATGDRTLVGPLSHAAAAIGSDGLLIEVHPDPAAALSDGAQSLTVAEFRELMEGRFALWRDSRRTAQHALGMPG